MNPQREHRTRFTRRHFLRGLGATAALPLVARGSAGGHGKLPVIALVTYCNFACIYRVSPVGLNDPQPGLDALSPDLEPLLQRLAWEAATAHPMSGVTPPTAGLEAGTVK